MKHSSGPIVGTPGQFSLCVQCSKPLNIRFTTYAVPAEAAIVNDWIPAGLAKTPGPRPGPRPRLDPDFAPLFTRAVYDSVQEINLMSEAAFQTANFRLRDREYKYYFEANKDRLDRVPDLSDMSGGLSNPAYFNFVYYIAWKIVALNLKSAEGRTEFNTVFGKNLLNLIAPDSKVALQGAHGKGTAAAPETVQKEIESVLRLVEAKGYVARSQVVWGQSSADLPYDWQSETNATAYLKESVSKDGELAAFQVRLRLPADIEGSVSLRSEEDGFWSRSISSVLQNLLEDAGYQSTVDEVFFQDEWQPPKSFFDNLLLMIGDPLMKVEVPWEPQSLVQNWTVHRST